MKPIALDEIEPEATGDHLAIKPVRPIRAGWEEAFRKMHERGDDRLLDEEDAHTETEWDRHEWKW